VIDVSPKPQTCVPNYTPTDTNTKVCYNSFYVLQPRRHLV